MPGTHLLPPNLLKLFAPRPPLLYSRPVVRDIDRVKSKNVTGVAAVLAVLRESNTQSLIASNGENMEEGEEPAFTLAEEVKRQIRREERRAKRAEEFKIAKETCPSFFSLVAPQLIHLRPIDKPADDAEAVGDPYKTLFISRLVCAPHCSFPSSYSRPFSIKVQRKQTFAVISRAMELLSVYESSVIKKGAVEAMLLSCMSVSVT